jgi:hypothetical protein
MVTIERNQRMIRSYERRIQEDTTELATVTDDAWKKYLMESIALSQRRVGELEAEIRKAQGIS